MDSQSNTKDVQRFYKVEAASVCTAACGLVTKECSGGRRGPVGAAYIAAPPQPLERLADEKYRQEIAQDFSC